MNKRVTYKQAGVDINEANLFVKNISRLVRSTHRPEVMDNITGFGSCFAFKKERYQNPVLVSSTDGVGTKLKIAILAGKHDTVGIDLVAMNVNDVLAAGAAPLFFLDYIAVGKINKKKLVDIVAGIATGCRESGCALIGGETAEMPVLYRKDEYDLAGFCVGVAEKKELLPADTIMPDDVLVGIESSGLHSNGFSLVHKVFSEKEIKRKALELLRPTRIYVKPILSLKKIVKIKGLAHITGGAFYEKLTKIFPKSCSLIVNKSSWTVPDIFNEIQQRGNISDKEMFRTFNMGVGMVVVVERSAAEKVCGHLKRFHLKSWVIGEVVKGGERIRIK